LKPSKRFALFLIIFVSLPLVFPPFDTSTDPLTFQRKPKEGRRTSISIIEGVGHREHTKQSINGMLFAMASNFPQDFSVSPFESSLVGRRRH
jgi:hypothetical protein